MPKYKCNNKDCEKFNVEITESSTTKIVNGELIDSAIKCKDCNSDRELIISEGMTTFMQGGPNVCKK